MKLFKSKNITNIIYALFMLVPFLSILGRVIYVQANPNAKDSYYADTINQSSIVSLGDKNVDFNTTYTLYVNQDLTFTQSGFSIISDLVVVERGSIGNSDYQSLIDNINSINRIYYYDNVNNLGFYFYNNDDNSYNWIASISFSSNSQFSFKSATLNNQLTKYYTYLVYNNYSFMDNVFDYSVSTFIDENNLGNIDFFSWFTGLFVNKTGNTALYINFANWYMNYALLVSSGYLLFLCLMWFINYVRKILDKSAYHDFGGF